MLSSNKINRKIKIFFIFIPILITLILIFIISLFDNSVVVIKDREYLYANKISSIFYKIKFTNWLKNRIAPFEDDYQIKGINNFEKIKLIKADSGFYIEGKFDPCIVEFKIIIDKKEFYEKLILLDDVNDFDKDGFPDVAELISESDRNNFIEWFVSIAESQYYVKSHKWEKVHHDCAGLINFCYKEALKKHDNDWYKNFSYIVNKDIPDVNRFNYPDIPVLNDNVFRSGTGVFNSEDLSKDIFKTSADANNLLNFNLNFISRSISMIKKGDLLFFNVIQNIPETFHTMIYTGNEDYLIYHTGDIDESNEGEVRKVKLHDLFLHPDKNWHPEEANPSFLGIYRWKLLS